MGYDQPMATPPVTPRTAEARVLASLVDSPVVLIHGPRQCGKTTLAQSIGQPKGYDYFSFDDDLVRQGAESDPIGFVADLPERAILDEVQRVPHLFTTLKLAVDRDRRAGRFLLTGSTNLLLLPQLADSLAGRMETVRLHPFAQCEIEGRRPAFLAELFEADFPIRRSERLGRRLAERVVAGGYPAALARQSQHRRAAWYRGYVGVMVQRDARDIARIASLDALPRLLTLAAAQTAQLLNVSDLAGSFQLSRPTIRSYLTLLGQLFLVDELPPWHSNRLSRLIKTPKLHIGDTGLATALLGLDAEGLWEDRKTYGHLLETFVYQELRRQASGREDELHFHHYRDKDGYEVDVVLEAGGRRIAGVEVKASATVRQADFRGLRRLAAAVGESFAAGVVLYDGETTVGFGEGMYAVPIGRLWAHR